MAQLNRIDPQRVSIDFNNSRKATLFANESVYVDRQSIINAENFSKIYDSFARLGIENYIGDLVFTPDFHKGTSTPIGTVLETIDYIIPGIVGNDIGCGMTCYVINGLDPDQLKQSNILLDNMLRHAFFEGGRNIQLSTKDRENILLLGPQGLSDITTDSLITHYKDKLQNSTQQVGHKNSVGIHTALVDWLRSNEGVTRDAHLGSVGGGNHFVELQYVAEIFDKTVAYQLGLKQNSVVLMVHSGSLSLGRAVATIYSDKAKTSYPTTLKVPENGLIPILNANDSIKYIEEMSAAANFASVNRFCMAAMVVNALDFVFKKPLSVAQVANLPHNFAWSNNAVITHRKGSCNINENDIFIVPGSMGTSSFIMRGNDTQKSLHSGPHGAGRAKARGESRNNILDNNLRVIGKIDTTNQRTDVRKLLSQELSTEAPSTYKDINSVISTIVDANISNKVARMSPILTVKG